MIAINSYNTNSLIMTEVITYIFEILATLISFWVSIIVIKQKKTSQVPLGNLFLAIGALSLGIFTLSTIIYSIIGQALVIIIFLKLGMVSNMFGVLMLFYTMLVLIHSSKLITLKNPKILYSLIIYLIIAIILIATDYIEVIDAATAETVFDTFQFLIYALFVSVMLIVNAVYLYSYGIKKVPASSAKKMKFFLYCIIFFICGLISDAVGNFIDLEVLTDTLLFGFLTLGILFGAFAFTGKKEKF